MRSSAAHLGLALVASLAAAAPLVMQGCSDGDDGDDRERMASDGGAIDASVLVKQDAAPGADAAPVTDSGPTAATACTDLAHARCAALDQCSSSTETLARWGGVSVCQSRIAAQCLLNLAATGTGATTTTAEACAQALHDPDCSAVLGNTVPEECEPVLGTLPDLSPCFVAGQCQSSFCSLSASAACGLCQPSPEAGAPCTSVTDCGNRNDLGCAGGVCVSYTAPGAACEAQITACSPGYSCTRNKDAGATVDAGGTCQMERTSAGGTCDTTNYVTPNCDTTYGLACIGGTCTTALYVDAGEACGGNLDGSAVRCAASGLCMDAGVLNPKSGTCIAAAADNARCDLALGPSCLPQARCVASAVVSGVVSGADGGTAGTCLSLDNTTCNE